MDIAALCLESHQISHSKGWTSIKRTDAQSLNLMVSELSEALEDFRNNRGTHEVYYEYKTDHAGVAQISAEDREKIIRNSREKLEKFKPCGIPIELADCIIRMGQHCGTNKLDQDFINGMKMAQEEVREGRDKVRTDLNDMIADATYFLSGAWYHSPESGYQPPGNTDRNMFVFQIARALCSILNYCEVVKLDIETAIAMKHEYNRTRPHLHGGKRI